MNEDTSQRSFSSPVEGSPEHLYVFCTPRICPIRLQTNSFLRKYGNFENWKIFIPSKTRPGLIAPNPEVSVSQFCRQTVYFRGGDIASHDFLHKQAWIHVDPT